MNDSQPAVPPANWRTALADLIAARLALIQIELKEAAQAGARRAALFGASLVCIVFAWAILVAGAIGGISAGTGLEWYWVALIAGALHILVAVILIILGRHPGGAAFGVTLAEFKKDRAWLETLQSPPKSND